MLGELVIPVSIFGSRATTLRTDGAATPVHPARPSTAHLAATYCAQPRGGAEEEHGGRVRAAGRASCATSPPARGEKARWATRTVAGQGGGRAAPKTATPADHDHGAARCGARIHGKERSRVQLWKPWT